MKLEKAIELGGFVVKSLKRGKFYDHTDAVQLLIESGKYIERMREGNAFLSPCLLPGETED